MIKAASLLYAVLLCAIVASICGVLLYVFSIHKLGVNQLLIKGDLIENSDSCLSLFLSDLAKQGIQKDLKKEYQFDFCECVIESSKWGVYPLIKQKTFFKKDTLFKNRLIGNIKQSDVALYVSDLGESLKISGTTKLIGNVNSSGGRVEVANILGNQFVNNPSVVGGKFRSKEYLPTSYNFKYVLPEKNIEITLEELKEKGISFNGFNKLTYIVYLSENEFLDSIKLKGNFVLISKGEIHLSKNSLLEDVILVAPKVSIESGFKGGLQVFASNVIELGESVMLNYPSVLILNVDEVYEEALLTIGEKSKIYGGLVLDSKVIDRKKQHAILLAEKTSIYGDVYCNGLFEHKGIVKGSVYANKLFLKTAYSEYSDLLLNAVIDAKTLDSTFVKFPLIKDNSTNFFGIVKEF